MKDSKTSISGTMQRFSTIFSFHRLAFVVLLMSVTASLARAGELRIQAFHQLSPSQGWVVANNHLLVTDSAGTRWSDVTPPSAGAGIDGVFFLDRATGWVVISTPNAGPQLARTTDGGANWAIAGLAGANIEDGAFAYSGIASISFAGPAYGWILLRSVTSPNFSRGVLLATSNGGATWSRLPNPPIADGLTFVTRRNGWLAGGPDGSQIFLTRDGGNSWRAARILRPAEGQLSFDPPAFRNAQQGTVTARLTSGDNTVAVIFSTRNGGNTWRMDSAGLVTDATGGAGLASALAGKTAPVSEAARADLASKARAIVPGASFVRAELNTAGDGWLHAVAGECAGFKTACAQTTHLLAVNAGVVTEITPQLALQGGPSPFASTTISTNSGFDKCSAATVSQMSTWWINSPYFDANIYIGGVLRGCSQPNLTASWVTSIFGQGWRLIPTWVGPQAPCSTFSSKISTNTTTAFNQGVTEASSAVSAANGLGLSTSVVYYDMENYDSTNTTCKNAVNSFISGWVQRMHALSFVAGVYGSATDANSGWATVANVPDDVWIAKWDGRATTLGLTPLPDSLWSNNQRLHQYQGGHNETWGGITFNIDNDIENGRVAAP